MIDHWGIDWRAAHRWPKIKDGPPDYTLFQFVPNRRCWTLGFYRADEDTIARLYVLLPLLVVRVSWWTVPLPKLTHWRPWV